MNRLTAVALLLFCSVGCQNLLHERPLNEVERITQAPLGRTDGVYFSVDDPLDVPIPQSELTAPKPKAKDTFSPTSESLN